MSYSNSQNVQRECKMSGIDPNVCWTNCPACPKKIRYSLKYRFVRDHCEYRVLLAHQFVTEHLTDRKKNIYIHSNITLLTVS